MVGRKGTELTKDNIVEIIDKYANGVNESTIGKEFHIGYKRLKDIINNNRTEIERLRQLIRTERTEKLIDINTKRALEVVESISKEDIRKASLQAKARSSADMYGMARLAAGESTQNVAIASKDMSKEDILKDILEEDNTDSDR